MGLAGAVVGGQLGVLVAQVGFGLLANKFSRDLEDQADRVGLYYAWEAGYDVREAPKMWRGMMGDYKETSTGVFLYSDHPSMLSRYRNTNRMMAFNYAASDFSEAEVGREKFMDTVGVYFGWVAPKEKQVVKKNVPKTTTTTPKNVPKTSISKSKNPPATTTPKAVVDSPQQKIASVITFIVKQSNQPDWHSKGDVYASILLEGFDYIVALKTGLIVKKTKSAMKSFSEGYAEVGVNLLNSRMKETGQGAIWLLQQSGTTWKIVAMDEGGMYPCDKLSSVPQTVRQALKIECS
jgi:hypothetical protein